MTTGRLTILETRADVARTKANGELTVLGIETSCDETAAAIVRRFGDGRGEILSNVVRSQWQEHAAYGGVVPEIAARAHIACLDDIAAEAFATAGITVSNIDAVAATAGPGLIGGLLVGLTFAKSLALAARRPLIAVNHLEAHALTVGLTHGLQPPYLLLLVSGGHTQTVLVRAAGSYRRIGTTIDDALGEAFDKTAKLLGLDAPGGPAVERMALGGDPAAFEFPRPMLRREEPHFSFAGLKTSVRRTAMAGAEGRDGRIDDATVMDICASFQAAVSDVVTDRCGRALAIVRETEPDLAIRHFVIAGGVAANSVLRTALERFCADAGLALVVPPHALCTDNGAMIAWAGCERLASGLALDGFEQSARARWPLDDTAVPVVGHGRLGVKA